MLLGPRNVDRTTLGVGMLGRRVVYDGMSRICPLPCMSGYVRLLHQFISTRLQFIRGIDRGRFFYGAIIESNE